MDCRGAARLLDEYISALHEFHDAQARLDGMSSHDPNFERIKSEKQDAFAKVARARGLYWRHVQMHGCRGTAAPEDRPESLDSLGRHMLDARRRFLDATAAFDRSMQLAADCAGTPDGAMAREQSSLARRRAYESYRSTLRRFLDRLNEEKAEAGPRH